MPWVEGARVRSQVDWLRARPRDPRELDEGLRAVDDVAADLEATVATLLDTARATTTAGPGRAAVRPVLEELAARADDERAGVAVRSGPVTPARAGDADRDGDEDPAEPELHVGVDGAVLRRLLAPVVDNALRHARTRVDLSVTTTPEGVVVAVDDGGPGIPEHLAEEVVAPGVRGDPDDGHDGAGLGLSLARRLARAAGGGVTAGPPPGGQVHVALPPG